MNELVTTKAFDEGVDQLAEQAEKSERPVRFAEPDEALRTSVVQALLTRMQSPVVARIPTDPDQIERVSLDIGMQLGPEATREVDDVLRRKPERICKVLTVLLEDRPLVVDGRDHLGDLGSGTDETLRVALKSQLKDLSEFFDKRATVLVSSAKRRDPFAGGAPPFAVDESDPTPTWELSGCQTTTYQLWLSLRALQGRPVDEELPSYLPEADTLRDHLKSELSSTEVQLLGYLCAHARPLPRTIVDTLSLGSAVSYGDKLRIWHTDKCSVWVSRGWSRWWRNTQIEEHQREHHCRLASVFYDEAQRGVPEQAGPSLLEALRHYARAGDDEQAKRCARYGVGTLVERARALSHQRLYHRAASMYQFVVERAEVERAEKDRLPINSELHAYAVHYLHYNRNRASGAPLGETIEGYQRALVLWPDNALFWSRLIQAHVYNDDLPRALETLKEAKRAVPEHPQKYAVLVARTVERLLDENHKFEAALVWADHRQTSHHREQMAFAALRRALEKGWETDWLRIPKGPQLAFQRLVRVQLTFLERKQTWLAELRELNAWQSGPDPASALSSLIEALREETRGLVRALTHRLSATERLRKQLLLGTIDIVASGLQAEVPPYVWVIGELEQDANGWVFRTSEGRHELSPAAFDGLTFDRHTRFARFATDPIGRPEGPVLELSEPFRGDAGELLEELRRKQASG